MYILTHIRNFCQGYLAQEGQEFYAYKFMHQGHLNSKCWWVPEPHWANFRVLFLYLFFEQLASSLDFKGEGMKVNIFYVCEISNCFAFNCHAAFLTFLVSRIKKLENESSRLLQRILLLTAQSLGLDRDRGWYVVQAFFNQIAKTQAAKISRNTQLKANFCF